MSRLLQTLFGEGASLHTSEGRLVLYVIRGAVLMAIVTVAYALFIFFLMEAL